jgi:hypothetical protein
MYRRATAIGLVLDCLIFAIRALDLDPLSPHLHVVSCALLFDTLPANTHNTPLALPLTPQLTRKLKPVISSHDQDRPFQLALPSSHDPPLQLQTA